MKMSYRSRTCSITRILNVALVTGPAFCSALASSSVTSNPQKIAIVGSGAVGGYYGSRLWECGHDVHYHMRGDHFRVSTRDGLTVTSARGDIYIPPDQLQAYEKTEDIGTVDWVIVALKSTSLRAVPSLIYPLLDKDRTRVLCIMNGLIEEDLLMWMNEMDSSSSLSCCAAVIGGMALLCSNRLGPGRIDHSYAGLLSGGVAAASCGTFLEHEQAFQDLWEPAKVDIAIEPSLLKGRWTKNVWNLPFNGISVAMGGITVDKIVTDPGLRKLADAVMDETIAIANADLTLNGEDTSMFLGKVEKKRMMDLSDAMGPYKTSTMLDLTEKRPMEVQYLFRKPLERAEELGVPAPHLSTLVTQIEAYQRMYNLH